MLLQPEIKFTTNKQKKGLNTTSLCICRDILTTNGAMTSL